MATLKGNNYGRTPVPDRSGQVIIARYYWDVVAATNNDTVLIGQLPAGCRIVTQLCRGLVVGATNSAFTYDLWVDTSATKLISAQAVSANTPITTAATMTGLTADTLGKSSSNRDVVINLSTAPTTSLGKFIAEVAYVADP